VHDCAEEGGLGGEVDGDFGAFVVGFEGAGESGLGEGHWCGLAVFFCDCSVFPWRDLADGVLGMQGELSDDKGGC
jgi:hypothetical protein